MPRFPSMAGDTEQLRVFEFVLPTERDGVNMIQGERYVLRAAAYAALTVPRDQHVLDFLARFRAPALLLISRRGILLFVERAVAVFQLVGKIPLEFLKLLERGGFQAFADVSLDPSVRLEALALLIEIPDLEPELVAAVS